MNSIDKILSLADEYASQSKRSGEGRLTHAARQALEAELTRLFTPLSDEQIKQACKETWVFDTAKQWVSNVEAMHGIGGES